MQNVFGLKKSKVAKSRSHARCRLTTQTGRREAPTHGDCAEPNALDQTEYDICKLCCVAQPVSNYDDSVYDGSRWKGPSSVWWRYVTSITGEELSVMTKRHRYAKENESKVQADQIQVHSTSIRRNRPLVVTLWVSIPNPDMWLRIALDPLAHPCYG